MDTLIEAITTAVADGATAEQKAHGASACRTILIALGAEPGKVLVVPNAPAPHPLAGIDPGQAIDLFIAQVSAKLAAAEKAAPTTQAPTTAPRDRGIRIEFVTPPPARRTGPRRRTP